MWVMRGVDPPPRRGGPAPAVCCSEQVLILIEDVSWGLNTRQGRSPGGGVKKLIVDVKLEQVPLGQTGVQPWPLPLSLTRLMRMFSGPKARRRGRVFGQPPVQPLAASLEYGEFLHGDTTFLGIFLLTMRPNGCILLL